MPSLFRFIIIVGILVGLAYAGVLLLVGFVEPQPREMIQTIPASRLNK